jgi:hypothetical protein
MNRVTDIPSLRATNYMQHKNNSDRYLVDTSYVIGVKFFIWIYDVPKNL